MDKEMNNQDALGDEHLLHLFNDLWTEYPVPELVYNGIPTPKFRALVTSILKATNPTPVSVGGVLQVLERILDSKHEADKWAHEAEKLYVELGGQKLSLIAPTARERLLARKAERNPTPVSVGGEDAISLVQQERRRQIEQEGWSTEHDDEHIMGEMIGAAVTYAAHALEIVSDHELPGADNEGWWPWEEKWWKPSPDPIRNLVKSAALIVAEIERLQREKGTHDTPK